MKEFTVKDQSAEAFIEHYTLYPRNYMRHMDQVKWANLLLRKDRGINVGDIINLVNKLIATESQDITVVMKYKVEAYDDVAIKMVYVDKEVRA